MVLDKKLIIVFVILLTITLSGVGVAILNNFRSDSLDNSSNSTSQPQDDYNVTQTEIEALEKGYIDIKNFDNLSPDSDPLVRQQAKSALYPVATNLKPEKPSYEGEIRQGTFVRRSFEGNHFQEKMIVDIPELKQSWGVITLWSRVEDSKNTDSHVYIVCLNKTLLKFGEFNCSTPYGKYEDY